MEERLRFAQNQPPTRNKERDRDDGQLPVCTTEGENLGLGRCRGGRRNRADESSRAETLVKCHRSRD